MNRSLLDEIPGIGEKTKERLLKKFGSVRKISDATEGELEKVIGAQKAAVLVAALKK